MDGKKVRTMGLSLKESAVSFLRLAASGRAQEAFERFVAPGFVHHNPYFPADADSLMHAMWDNALKNPGKTLEVQRALEDGPLVAVHSRVRLGESHPGIATVHIFRFEGGRIAELWDIGQQVPEESPNPQGMF